MKEGGGEGSFAGKKEREGVDRSSDGVEIGVRIDGFAVWVRCEHGIVALVMVVAVE